MIEATLNSFPQYNLSGISAYYYLLNQNECISAWEKCERKLFLAHIIFKVNQESNI